MIQFAILTNETRISHRPPLQVLQANPELLIRLVPVRNRVQRTTRPRPDPAISRELNGHRNGKKNLMSAVPVGLLSFPVRPDISDAKKESAPKPETKIGPAQPPLISDQGIDVMPSSPSIGAEFSSLPARLPEKKQEPPAAKPIVEDEQGIFQAKPKHELRKEPGNPVSPPANPKQSEPKTTDSASLQDLFKKDPDLPAQSVILGVCEDGLPLALDLYDPAPGSLLLMGDDRKDQVKFLRSVIASVALRNSPRLFQFLVISHQPDAWQSWIGSMGFDRHCLGVVAADENTAGEWALQAADWTELRRLGQRSGPPILLVIDSLSFLPRLPYDIRLNFDWMVKEGPAAQVWTLATISTDLAAAIGMRFLRPFQSKILGRANASDAYTRLVNLADTQADSVAHPGQFIVQVGETWLQFKLPDL